jgi:putative addiction module component (TIGR02574 family)
MLRQVPESTPDSLLSEALHLPLAQQVTLANQILASVESKGRRHAKAALQATYVRRLHELRTGAVKGLTVDEAMRRIRSGARRVK